MQRLLLSLIFCLITFSLLAQEQQQSSGDALAEMMAKAQKYTQPAEHHKKLERFVGEWDMEIRITMQGAPGTATKGSSTIKWLMPGRWLQMESTGTMMGLPLNTFTLLGYDNFKQSYVTTSVSSIDTAMNRSEGDFTPYDKALVVYGTLDEYLTGEHDKMVKTVYRFISDDELMIEVYDLPIGEVNNQVLEFKMTRKASEET